MKRLTYLFLAVVLVVAAPSFRGMVWAQDEYSSSGQGSDDSGDSKDPGDSGASGDSGGSDGSSDSGDSSEVKDTDDSESTGDGTSEEGKTYVCPKCGYSDSEPGNCPGCNVSLTEQKEGSSGGSSGETDSSSEGSDSGSGNEHPSDGGSDSGT